MRSSQNVYVLVSNRYDHLGRRVQKITPEATHTYFYDFTGTVPDRFFGGGPEIVEQEKPYTRFPTVVEGKVEPDGKLHLTVHDILHGVVAFNTVI